MGRISEAPRTAGTDGANAAPGPLEVCRANPRYFAVPAGGHHGQRVVYLTGSHINNNLQDGMGPGLHCPELPEESDFTDYLGFLEAHGHNFIRLWRWEHFESEIALANVHLCMSPQPWPRTGSGTATDGKPKFDLAKFDGEYFDRLRRRVMAAGARGIYVSVLLFEGFGLHLCRAPNNLAGHPFHASNNVNGVGIRSIDDYQVLPLDPRVMALQEAYLRRVIDTVGDLPNVLYEVANESSGGGTISQAMAEKLDLVAPGVPPPVWHNSTRWQYWVIDYVRQYESRRGHPRHPIGMTALYPVPDPSTANEPLIYSRADWISPGGGVSPLDDPTFADPSFARAWLENPPASDGRKVVLTDTDHYAPGKADPLWVWKSFLRGHNVLLHDLGIAGGAQPPDASWGVPSYGSFEATRQAMGETLHLAHEMNLAAMLPRDHLSSTGYALANLGAEYLVLQPADAGEPFTVALVPLTYSARWHSLATCEWRGGSRITALTIGPTPFTPPFPGPAVLYLKAA